MIIIIDRGILNPEFNEKGEIINGEVIDETPISENVNSDDISKNVNVSENVNSSIYKNVNSEIIENNTTEKKFFLEYLIIKKPIMEVMLSLLNNKVIQLKPKLLEVLSLLLYYNIGFDSSSEDPDNTLFSRDIRRAISEELQITGPQLNTYISLLRNYKILTDKGINKAFTVYPHQGFELIFKFLFNEE
jgi:hypothetical protein